MAATVATFTGGDPGEGLDLEGTFTYALNIGPSGVAGRVGDAVFQTDNVAGARVTAENAIATGGWGAANFGEGENDRNLATVMNSIRWSGSPATVEVVLTVEPGVDYKLQLLFRENCCGNRAFSVFIDGELAVASLMPALEQAGDGTFEDNRDTVGVVVTHEFTAESDELVIVLDGSLEDPLENDRNPILNGLTLERLTPVTDTDDDGLPDEWELRHFSNLEQGGSDDYDEDGLDNLGEFNAGTDPANADTDGDGLTDGEEVHEHKTSPTAVDTDGDRVPDSMEVARGSNPLEADSDGDGFDDFHELQLLTDPADPDSVPRNTVVVPFTGPDDLDFEGTFVYAVNAANEEDGGQIGDAYFTSDTYPGISLTSSGVDNNWNAGIDYGQDTAEQFVLQTVMRSIRWSDASSPTPAVTLTLSDLEPGATYKLQLLFSEYQWARGFDVYVNGRQVADDFAPFLWQGGTRPTPRNSGVALVRTFVANRSEAVIVLDGRGLAWPGVTDRNPILNGATLEFLEGLVDTDGDSLPDPWEMEFFGNLDQAAADDPDSDGLSNLEEFRSGTHPLRADTDGDGLSDGDEVNEHQTDPTRSDTDGDGLSDGAELQTHGTDPNAADTDEDGLTDGAEILTHGTDPLKADTDGDGIGDAEEIAFGLDPLQPEPPTEFRNVTVQSFWGGDPDEGLDLQGTFKYAINVGTTGAAGQAGDANFTADNVPGVTVIAQNEVSNWAQPEYGDSEADDVLERVMGSIRWSPNPQRWRVELANLVPGSTYKLQVLVFEQCCGSRVYNLVADGQTLVENFMPAVVHNGANNIYEGAVVSVEFTTHRSRLVIVGDGPGATEDGDRNATLSGITLEVLEEVDLPDVAVEVSDGNLVITFDGVLQSADSVEGPYEDVEAQSPVTVTPEGSMKFYRSVRR